jgi:hypothetical protein
VFSSCVDFLLQDDIVDADACLQCLVNSSRWRQHIVAATPEVPPTPVAPRSSAVDEGPTFPS